MEYISAAAIGSALAMDATAVSVSCGIKNRGKRLQTAVLTASAFGIFQMVMPILGWSIGKVGSSIISEFDHITAFIILLFMGIKMFFDAKSQDEPSSSYNGKTKELILLALATSIDALASGIVLPVSVGADSPYDMTCAVLIIGAITFLMSFTGYYCGSSIRGIKPQYAEIIGGTVLIIIGIKTLLTG